MYTIVYIEALVHDSFNADDGNVHVFINFMGEVSVIPVLIQVQTLIQVLTLFEISPGFFII